MSLASTTVFEVRPGVGSATNGGGFVPGSSGTDWSQQNAAQYNVTDGVANGTTTVTSATANFGTDVVGNIAYIGGAWYQIASRTNATTIVVDRSITAGSGLALKIGGALDLPSTAEPLLTAGMTLWIKATGTAITLTSTQILTASGDSTNGPIKWAGYHTTRGDHDGTRPLITSATNSVHLIQSPAGSNSFRIFDNLELSSTAGTPGDGFIASSVNPFNWTISNCYIHGCNQGIYGAGGAVALFLNLWVVNCEITACTADAINNAGSTAVDGCYLHGNAGYGFDYFTVGETKATENYLIAVSNSVIYGNSLGGIYIQSAAAGNSTQGPVLRISRCAVVSNTNDGIRNAIANGNLSILWIENSIIYGNSGFGINITNAAAMIVSNRNNAYGSNTSGPRNNLAAGANDVALSADPFTARTGNDFSLNTTAGGGAARRAAGFPGSIPGLVTAGNPDTGPLQHADPVGTGGNVLSSPRRICVLPPGRLQRRSTVVISSPGTPIVMPIIMSIRRRHYPVYVPVRRSVPSLPLLARPIVIRSPIRMVARWNAIRRNAGHSLFSQTVKQTVLVTSLRTVR